MLGAGISGLVRAYRLQEAGFAVTVLEARDRVGGRAWTVRSGDRVELLRRDAQKATLSDGIYFNAGAARITGAHTGILDYARRVGVALEVAIDSNPAAYLVGEDGSRLRQRAVVGNLRGRLAALLSQALDQGAPDRAVTPDDKERLLAFLRADGGLVRDGRTLPLSELLAHPQIDKTLLAGGPADQG